TVATFLGSVAAIMLAGALLKTFGGKGIVPDAITATTAFPISVGIAAALTVLLATVLGIPISTTHSIVGALVGVGIGSELIWSGVWLKFAWPLLAAPLLAVALTVPVYLVFRGIRLRLGVTRRSCVCVNAPEPETASAPVSASVAAPVSASASVSAPASASVPASASAPIRIRTGHQPDCKAGLHGKVVGIDAQRTLDVSHLVTAGAVSFARGLNDTPKVAAIMLAAAAVAAAQGAIFEAPAALLACGVGIALGGLLAAQRVANTMSTRITDMNDGQAFTANLVTAVLVIFASRLGVPVSTTHVSCGSLFGIGVANKSARWKMIGTILLAWVTTLPLGALLGWTAWQILA
ncbi:MAG: inorganic phosphate transporter, partial [Planctomycetes bacterium]|nr:inorganic phosphate transporter [Planctomycetota bacterium]